MTNKRIREKLLRAVRKCGYDLAAAKMITNWLLNDEWTVLDQHDYLQEDQLANKLYLRGTSGKIEIDNDIRDLVRIYYANAQNNMYGDAKSKLQNPFRGRPISVLPVQSTKPATVEATEGALSIETKVTKVLLPEEVGDALETIIDLIQTAYAHEISNRPLESILTDWDYLESRFPRTAQIVKAYAISNMLDYVRAITEGFEVMRKSPEERLLLYYNELTDNLTASSNPIDYTTYESQLKAVQKTLELLQLDIVGITS